MGAQKDEATTPQDTLAPYFDNSAAAVRRSVEEGYVLPLIDLSKALFSAYPVPFAFFSIFTALAFFPLLTFVIVSVVTLATTLTLALCLAFAFSTGVFLFSGGVLLAILGLTLLFSGFLTIFALSAYLFARLILLLHHSGRGGFTVWSREVSQVLFPSSTSTASTVEDSYASEDSGVIVGREGKSDHAVKIELASEQKTSN
ncbi:hypothetical protein BC834DRAFT_968799 [Gloeopeniophorella convolvens]|nr:hypothetical protein BC834DRAFT_968799 [Gloeopeniophorella convolvens]